jgi:hypothetical protein|nr:MAG TPA: protein of unknown function (DUF333) [Caudoviricetes sp.]DAL21517.1 MAG TPA_asm: protein of unknown function (DUF333) [Caudoviricetes sp.]DAU50164.1 MAG TPA: protein of unknown function (DUF333) [Caudoviricetes sp.]
MPIKPNFTAADIRARMSQMLELRKKALIGQLFYIGEECLTQARSGHKYLNQTGNLCSSIGYCILDNGKIISEGEWKAVAGGKGDGEEGKKQGVAFLHDLAAKQTTKGIVFLMVAGMPYAQYVEAMSLDVLDTSEQMAQRKIKDMLNRLFKTKNA